MYPGDDRRSRPVKFQRVGWFGPTATGYLDADVPPTCAIELEENDMSQEATPLFGTTERTPREPPRHRRAGHFDDADRWHDAPDDESLRSTA